MPDHEPGELAAFLAVAEHAIIQAVPVPDGTSEPLRATACYYAPRLLAAVEAVRDMTGEPGALISCERIRETISRALLGEAEK